MPRIAFRTLLYTAVLALVVRLVYLTEHAATPLFAFPVLDELYYHTVARLLHDGDRVAAINPGFRPLLYPMILSLFHGSGAAALPAAIVFQHLLGVVNALLVALLAFRLTASNPAALAAAALFVLAGPPLFFEGQILATTLATFLNLVLVLVFARLPRDADRAHLLFVWAFAGALLGLAMQARANVVLFALALPLAWWVHRRGEKRLDGRGPLAAVAGLVACLALFGVIQQPHFERFQLVPGAGGVNFYLGNKQGADGMVPRQDRRVTYGDEYRDSVQVFAREEYARRHAIDPQIPSARQISSYWLGRGFREILADPVAWGGLTLRKIWFLLWNREIANNMSYAFVLAEESSVLRWLPVRWWLLVALAPLGIAWCRGHGESWTFFWLASFVALWSAGVVLFFVNGRYRAPLWPFLCVLAAAGLLRLWDQATAARARGAWRPLLVSALVFLAGAAVSLGNWLGIEKPAIDRQLFYRSLAHLDRGELEEAAADAARAVALEPEEPMYVFQQGSVDLARDRFAAAAAAFRRAAELKPREPRIWNNLGIAEERLGRPGPALAAYHTAIDQIGDYTPALTNAALLELRAGRPDEAARHLEAAAAAGDDSIYLLAGRALLARARGDEAASEHLLAEARRRDPDTTARLERESRRPLDLGPPPG